MLINTLPRAHHAIDALKEVLMTISADILECATVDISLLGTYLNQGYILA